MGVVLTAAEVLMVTADMRVVVVMGAPILMLYRFRIARTALTVVAACFDSRHRTQTWVRGHRLRPDHHSTSIPHRSSRGRGAASGIRRGQINAESSNRSMDRCSGRDKDHRRRLTMSAASCQSG